MLCANKTLSLGLRSMGVAGKACALSKLQRLYSARECHESKTLF